MWYDVRPWSLGADGANRNYPQQNLARQYAANFGKHGAKDPLSYHLIQNTESVLVMTTMDLVPPRGDGIDHSGENVKLELEPRGFFADQFEVGFFLSPPRLRRRSFVGLFYVLRPGMGHAHDPVTATAANNQKG